MPLPTLTICLHASELPRDLADTSGPNSMKDSCLPFHRSFVVLTRVIRASVYLMTPRNTRVSCVKDERWDPPIEFLDVLQARTLFSVPRSRYSRLPKDEIQGFVSHAREHSQHIHFLVHCFGIDTSTPPVLRATMSTANRSRSMKSVTASL